MRDRYWWDGEGDPDPEVKRLEDLLRPLRYHHRRLPLPRHSGFRPLFVAAAMAACLVIAFGVWRLLDPATVTGFEVLALEGSPSIDGRTFAGQSRLALGDVLITDSVSRALVTVQGVGTIEAEPGTRLSISDAGQAQRRLELLAGTVHGTIVAPTGQFTIATPATLASVVSGEFTLTADWAGAGWLCVTSGWVSLGLGDCRSIVPAGAVCETRPGYGPGTPFCENSTGRFRTLLEHLDFPVNGANALDNVLAEAGPCDLLPLWHLLRRVSDVERLRVYDRMVSFAPPPPEVTRDGVNRLDRSVLEYWWHAIRDNQACLLCDERPGYTPDVPPHSPGDV